MTILSKVTWRMPILHKPFGISFFWCYTKHPHVKYFDYVLLVFFSQLLFIEDIFLFFLFINLQVEHIIDKCYNEP
jgi:hypothetical protein